MHCYHGRLVVACQTDLVDAMAAETELVAHARCPSCQVACRLHLTVWEGTWVVVIHTLDAAVAGAVNNGCISRENNDLKSPLRIA